MILADFLRLIFDFKLLTNLETYIMYCFVSAETHRLTQNYSEREKSRNIVIGLKFMSHALFRFKHIFEGHFHFLGFIEPIQLYIRNTIIRKFKSANVNPALLRNLEYFKNIFIFHFSTNMKY